jgi:hypothetical protein
MPYKMYSERRQQDEDYRLLNNVLDLGMVESMARMLLPVEG